MSKYASASKNVTDERSVNGGAERTPMSEKTENRKADAVVFIAGDSGYGQQNVIMKNFCCGDRPSGSDYCDQTTN